MNLNSPVRIAGVYVSLLLLVLVSCGNREEVLPGERFEIYAPSPDTETTDETEAAQPQQPDVVTAAVRPFSAPPTQAQSRWTHRNGSATHNIAHPPLRRNLSQIWSQNIGSGNSKRLQITSDPVIDAGRIYTLDSSAGLRAFSTSGALLWSVDLTPLPEKSGIISGGGLAIGEGILAATTGLGEVIALDPVTGNVHWRHRMDASIAAAPVISGGRVIAVARNSQALGLDISNGRILWQQKSSEGDAGLFGGSNPAATDNLAVLPFASGEVIGALTRNGIRAWSAAVTGGRKGVVRGFIGDISGDPVIDGQTIYLGNQSGRLISIDRRSGIRNWSANEGAYGPVWPAGDSVFVVTDQSKLKRLNASDGAEIWSVDLPDFGRKRRKNLREAFAHFGPVLAGGRLIVAGSDGLMRSFNPSDGALVNTVDIPGGAASQPAIAGGALYILSSKGQLLAFK